MAEEARLESVYTSKAYPEFESRSLRQKRRRQQKLPSFLFVHLLLEQGCLNVAKHVQRGQRIRGNGDCHPSSRFQN